jgi:hypothetical protein
LAIWREDFSLNDREIDFDLIEPAGVEGCMNERMRITLGRLGVGASVTQPVGGLLPSMSRAVVHNPKDAASRFIRLLPHDFHDFAHKPIYDLREQGAIPVLTF